GLTFGRTTDELEVDLLQAFVPWALAGSRHPAATQTWVDHLHRLWKETVAWQQANEMIGARYFAGVTPAFQDAAEQLEQVGRFCGGAAARFETVVRRRKHQTGSVSINLDELRSEATALVAPHVEVLVRRAKEQLLVLNEGRSGS